MNGHLVCLVIAVCQMIWTGGAEGKPGPQPGLFSCDTLAAIVKPWCMVKDAIQLSVVKLREREGQRVDLGRSLKGHL